MILPLLKMSKDSFYNGFLPTTLRDALTNFVSELSKPNIKCEQAKQSFKCRQKNHQNTFQEAWKYNSKCHSQSAE